MFEYIFKRISEEEDSVVSAADLLSGPCRLHAGSLTVHVIVCKARKQGYLQQLQQSLTCVCLFELYLL